MCTFFVKCTGRELGAILLHHTPGKDFKKIAFFSKKGRRTPKCQESKKLRPDLFFIFYLFFFVLFCYKFNNCQITEHCTNSQWRIKKIQKIHTENIPEFGNFALLHNHLATLSSFNRCKIFRCVIARNFWRQNSPHIYVTGYINLYVGLEWTSWPRAIGITL